MKKCVFLVSGLSRSFEQTCKNIFDKIIIPNMCNVNFDIYICDDLEAIKTPKWNNNNIDKKNNKIHKNKLLECYNKFNQVKEIVFWHWDGITISKNAPIGCGVNVKRWAIIFDKINFNDYDYFVIIRPDVIINKTIYLYDYKNTFGIISGNFIRPCHWHNRDWDYIWIGDKAFLFWLIPYMYEYRIRDMSITYENILNNFKTLEILPDKEVIDIKNKVGCSGTNNHHTVEYYSRIIKFMTNNGFKFEWSEYKEIYATIVR
jgi:hypothetical protein